MHANIDFVWFLNFPGNYLLNLFPKCLRHSTQATHIQPIFCRRALQNKDAKIQMVGYDHLDFFAYRKPFRCDIIVSAIA